MCEYCDDGMFLDSYEDMFTNIDLSIYGIQLVTIFWADGNSDSYDDYDIQLTTKINYCPMCGREL